VCIPQAIVDSEIPNILDGAFVKMVSLFSVGQPYRVDFEIDVDL
jgi:hypothetical protein